jgi:hypothetical protein
MLQSKAHQFAVAVSVMAQLIGKQITILYKERRDAPDTELRTLRFDP